MAPIQIFASFLAVALLSYSNWGQAQTAKSAVSESRKVLGQSSNPFNLEASTLGPAFGGNSFPILYRKLLSHPTKREFESSEAFEARIDRWVNTPLYGNVMPTSMVALEVRQFGAESGIQISYDADQQEFTASLKFDDIDFEPHDGRWVQLSIVFQRAGTRVARTVMGVPFNVQSVSASSTGLHVRNEKGPSSVSFSVPRAEAPSMKRKLRAFAVVQPKFPFVVQREERRNTRLDYPYEGSVRHFGIAGDLQGFFVIDITTGNILGSSIPIDAQRDDNELRRLNEPTPMK